MIRVVTSTLLALLIGWSTPARAAPTYLLILGGGTAPADAEQQRDAINAPLFKSRLKLAPGYVQIEESAKVAGLTPGFFVATLGSCADRDQALRVLHGLKRLIGQASASPKPYLRPINDGRAESCPTLLEPLLCHDVQQCATQCAAGEAAACNQQAFLLGGLGEPVAEALVEKACTLGYAESCAWLGRSMYKKPEVRFRYNDRACQLGNLLSCVEVAASYLEGAGAPKDPPKGMALLEKTCKRGEQSACRSLGSLYFDSTDPALQKRGRRILRDLCSSGDDPVPCRKIGDLKGACDAGDINACCERNPRSKICDV